MYISLHLTFLHRLAKYCRRAAKPAKSVIFPFRRIFSPLLGGCKRPGFPIQMLFTSFLRIPLVIYFMFFACKTQSPPGRSRLASLSTNLICRIFSGMYYFLRIFFIFFANYSIVNLAYYLQLIHLNAIQKYSIINT